MTDVNTLRALLERVEAGNLDWLNNDLANIDPSYNEHTCQVPKYCTSIDAAVAFFEAVLPVEKFILCVEFGPDWAAVRHVWNGCWVNYKEATDCASAPIAIVAATLKALIAKGESDGDV